jgi:MYXO-CTERM domain-containing protein
VIVKGSQVTGVAQQVMRNKPGATVGAMLAVLGVLVLRRGRRRRKKDQQKRRRSRKGPARRWAPVLTALGFVLRRRRRRRDR